MKKEKKTNVFIIHGAYGHPGENWFPWLKSELEKIGIATYVPKFPTPEKQTLDNWFRAFQYYESLIHSGTIMVGHSLGPAFILNLLEKLDKPIKAAFLVSSFIGLLNNPDFDSINKTFTDRDFDFDKIKKNCSRFYIYHSDNDPYVPIEKAKYLAGVLDAEFKVVPNAGHFNEAAGYKKFPLLFEDIKRLIYPE